MLDLIPVLLVDFLSKKLSTMRRGKSSNQRNKRTVSKIHVGIITIIPDIERLSVLRALNIDPSIEAINIEERPYWVTTVSSSHHKLNIAVTIPDKQGNAEAQTATSKMISGCKPELLILVGIAAGVRDKIKLADVVVSEAVIHYERAKLMVDKIDHRYEIRTPDNLVISTLQSFFKSNYKSNWHRIFDSLQRKLSTREMPDPPEYFSPECQFKYITTGEKILADGSLKKMAETENSNIRAGETEAWGFLTAANAYNKNWLVVRGISDFGDEESKDGKNKDQYHYCAANAAASFTRAFLESEFIGNLVRLNDKDNSDQTIKSISPKKIKEDKISFAEIQSTCSHPDAQRIKQNISTNNEAPLTYDTIHCYKETTEITDKPLNPTIFFNERMCDAFPGIRDLNIINNASAAINRLNILLRQPLKYEHRSSPIWVIFETGSMEIYACQRIDDKHILINDHELKISKLAVYRSDSYWNHFLYIECAPDKPTGLYPHLSKEYLRQWEKELYPYTEAYAIWKDRLLTYEEYSDCAVIINGQSKPITGAQLRKRYLTPANIIISSRLSPIHDISFDRKRREYFKQLLQKQMSVEQFVHIADQLQRTKADLFWE